MPVQITLGKTKPQEPAVNDQEAVELTEDQKLAAEVDELATLSAWAKKVGEDPRMNRIAELTKKFKDKANAEPTDQDAVVFEGNKFRYEFGKPANERAVTPEGIEKFANKIGNEAFLKVVTVPLKALDDYIPKNEQKDYVKTGFGSRSGKLKAKVVKK
jgi:hypothetical protein